MTADHNSTTERTRLAERVAYLEGYIEQLEARHDAELRSLENRVRRLQERK